MFPALMLEIYDIRKLVFYIIKVIKKPLIFVMLPRRLPYAHTIAFARSAL